MVFADGITGRNTYYKLGEDVAIAEAAGFKPKKYSSCLGTY